MSQPVLSDDLSFPLREAKSLPGRIPSWESLETNPSLPTGPAASCLGPLPRAASLRARLAFSFRGRPPPGSQPRRSRLLGRLGPTFCATFREKRECSDGSNFPPRNVVTATVGHGSVLPATSLWRWTERARGHLRRTAERWPRTPAAAGTDGPGHACLPGIPARSCFNMRTPPETVRAHVPGVFYLRNSERLFSSER